MTDAAATAPLRTRVPELIVRAIGSWWFFGLIVLGFLVSALSIALTAPTNSLLIDEAYHARIIQAYATQVGPFFRTQTAATASVGDLEAFGSFLYHWLMSFPYRWLVAAGASVVTQFAVLRVITIAMCGYSLYWFRRTLTDVGLSAALANISIAVYACLPVVSFQGATINYDNLMLLLISMHFSLAVRLMNDRRRSVAFYLAFLTTGGLASIAKFEVLPIFLVTIIVVAVRYFLLRREQPLPRHLPYLVTGGVGGWVALGGSAVGFVLAGSLAGYRYVSNLVRFGSVRPDCAQLHTVAFCRNYAVWNRDYELRQAHPNPDPVSAHSLASYIPVWVKGTLETTHVVGIGGQGAAGPGIFSVLLSYAAPVAVVLFAIGLGLILRKPGFVLLIIAAAFYTVLVFGANYDYFLVQGAANEISDRYVLMFAPILIGATGYSLRSLMRLAYPRQASWVLIAAAAVLAVLSTQGGWLTTYWFSAPQNWVDPASALAHLAPAIKRVVETIVV